MPQLGSQSDTLMGKPNQLPYDIQSDVSPLERKKKLLQAILLAAQQGGSPTIQAGPGQVQANWSEPLGKALSALIAQGGMAQLDDEQRQVAAAQQARHGAAVDQFSGDMAAVGTEPQGPTMEGGNLPKVTEKEAVTRAMMNAMKSQDPSMMGLATEGIKHQLTGQLTPKDRLTAGTSGGMMPGSVMGDIPDMTPMPTQKVSDGMMATQTFKPGGSMGDLLVNAINNYKKPTPATPFMPAVQEQEGTGEVKALGGGQLAPLQPGKTFNQDLQKADIAELVKGKDEGEKAMAGLQLNANAQTLLSKIPDEQFGALGGIRVFGNQILQSLGGEPLPASVKLETLSSTLGETMLANLRLFAPVSDSDKAEMKQIAGSIGNTKAGLQAMLDLQAKILAQKINRGNKFATSLQGQEGYPDDLTRWMTMGSRTGEAPPSGQPAKLNLEQFKKKP